ncbi:DUF397 domain-containing protein [Actinomadura oligospora]|uniref:DUF397 domain-containing protein n=1 Tax=Actinomadura oligospora TaxID=111804 RepID=UPI000A012C8A|nr:DUF397 domain-containing protein [Actinomadura oligospora]
MTLWRKSSHSESGAGGTCVELANLGTSVGVRDSKAPRAGHLTLTRTDLHQLTQTVRGSRR